MPAPQPSQPMQPSHPSQPSHADRAAPTSALAPVVPPVLAEVVRSGFVEGRHRGSLVVLGATGRWSWRWAR